MLKALVRFQDRTPSCDCDIQTNHLQQTSSDHFTVVGQKEKIQDSNGTL